MTPLKAIEILELNLREAKSMHPDARDAIKLAIKHLLIGATDTPNHPTIPLPNPQPQDFRLN
jgi:hypothetical protein